MEHNQIGQSKRLKKLLKALNVNQSVFAKSLGMTQPNISRMASGEGKISVEVLNRITTTYKQVNLHWLITGDGEMFFYELQDKSPQMVEEPLIKTKGRLEDLEERLERLEEVVKNLVKSHEK